MIDTRISGFALPNRPRSFVLPGGSTMSALNAGWLKPEAGLRRADHGCPTGGRAVRGFERRYAMNVPGRALSEGPPG